MSEIKTVTVLGTGVLGAQIAFQTAYSGFDVTAYDISDAALAQAKQRFAGLAATYLKDVPGADRKRTDAALERIRYVSDLGAAAAGADLVIEAIPEVLTLKQETFARLGKLAPAKTIFATNSSTLLPSDMKEATGRPDRFLALHFANEVWAKNTGEVMGHPGTDPEVFEQVARFAEEIGMVPIRIHKEQPGYVLNSLLVPFLNAAAALLVKGIASPEDIDRTWKIATGAPTGPFEIYDVVGMTTPYNLGKDSPDPVQREFAEYIKREYIDKGYLGKGSGRGFYDYE